MDPENTNPEGEVSEDQFIEQVAGLLTAEREEETPEREVEDTQDAETEAPQVRRYRVKVDGQEQEVAEDELIAGYQRQQDYTRKTQAAAEERRAIEAERQRTQQERAYYAQTLAALQHNLQPPQIDWEGLKASDPLGYIDAVRQEQERHAKAQWVAQEQARIHQQHEVEQQTHFAQYVQTEAEKLAALIPEYGNEATRKTVQAAIKSYAQSIGFSADELAAASDSRAVLVLDKARRYDELMAKVKNVKSTVTPMAKSSGMHAAKPVNKALERLKQTGSDADALAVFSKFVR